MKLKKLDNKDLEKVSGGFVQSIEGAWSYGVNIICPNCSCNNEDSDEFYCDSDTLAAVQKDLYTCAICGQMFAAATGYGITDIIEP
ncbi:MAG: hypothetical protein K5668_06040 [Lachnospiraceae bacterium]|nr:hypothetical protein [Lachnospiraceae bacterium]